jgi:hypothetical protein
MKKILLLLFVLAAVAGGGFAKEMIAVLPFTGGQNDAAAHWSLLRLFPSVVRRNTYAMGSGG